MHPVITGGEISTTASAKASVTPAWEPVIFKGGRNKNPPVPLKGGERFRPVFPAMDVRAVGEVNAVVELHPADDSPTRNFGHCERKRIGFR